MACTIFSIHNIRLEIYKVQIILFIIVISTVTGEALVLDSTYDECVDSLNQCEINLRDCNGDLNYCNQSLDHSETNLGSIQEKYTELRDQIDSFNYQLNDANKTIMTLRSSLAEKDIKIQLERDKPKDVFCSSCLEELNDVKAKLQAKEMELQKERDKVKLIPYYFHFPSKEEQKQQDELEIKLRKCEEILTTSKISLGGVIGKILLKLDEKKSSEIVIALIIGFIIGIYMKRIFSSLK